MNKYKITFNVKYMPSKTAAKISVIMSGRDPEMGGVYTEDEFSWITRSEPSEAYIDKMKKILITGIEKQGGRVCDVELTEKYKII